MKQLLILSLIVVTGLACNNSKKVACCAEDEYKNNSPLIGKWEVIQANITPFEHISFCEKLGLGAMFEFQKDSVINVYPKAGKKVCNRDQVYWIWKGNIRITEIDMVFLYKIEMLTTDTLKINMNQVPHYFNSMKHAEDVNVEELKKEGVQLTLIKK